ncbi:unnamed protein product, partial [Rotaria magnacalcarata]
CSKPICGQCIRYAEGFDITGATNEVEFTFQDDHIECACDCFEKCRQRPTTCANWVWKYTDNSGYRTCALYSHFNLPTNVTIGFDLSTSMNLGVISGGSPQQGTLVPHCQFFYSNGTAYGHDEDCVSGPLWTLDNYEFIC